MNLIKEVKLVIPEKDRGLKKWKKKIGIEFQAKIISVHRVSPQVIAVQVNVSRLELDSVFFYITEKI